MIIIISFIIILNNYVSSSYSSYSNSLICSTVTFNFCYFIFFKEINRFKTDPVEGISIAPHEENIRYIDAYIAGPQGSPYEGGKFKLEIFLGEGYPMDPPLCRFLTPVYHPNIDKLGRICLDILKDAWTPAIQIRSMLLSIQALMSAPNLDGLLRFLL